MTQPHTPVDKSPLGRPAAIPDEPATLVELVRSRAAAHPDRTVCTFLRDGERDAAEMTYGELDEGARALAARLQETVPQGGRVLLAEPPGLGYVRALAGCLYAGAVAVPAFPPERRTLRRLGAIVADAQPDAVVGPAALAGAPGELGRLARVGADEVDADRARDWREPAVAPGAPAILQYTSGSTGSARGVVLSHRSVLENERGIRAAFGHGPEHVVVGWLPPFHDMGLIGTILHPIYLGSRCVLMAPAHFLQRPARWLEAVSRHRGDTSGGPNFGYELCVRRTTPEERASLDLECWTLAFNGAEPVRAETLDRFAAAFAPHGFSRDAFYPCYGLAEATLMVSGGERGAPPVLRRAPGASGAERVLVGCGRPLPGGEVAIVDPRSHVPVAPGEEGEIWVRAPSVADGYWNRPAETEATFGARLAGDGGGPYLRTGDLGLREGDELFVTGRLKDLIVVRGANHHPADVEAAAQRAHAALRPGSGAAFSVDGPDGERVVLVNEVDHARLTDLGDAVADVRAGVFEEHELLLHALVLVEPGTVPKTTSGKVMRGACRAAFEAGSLAIAGEWRAALADAPQPRVRRPAGRAASETERLLARIACELLALERVDPDQSLLALGADSLLAGQLLTRVRAELGVDVALRRLFEAPTVAGLARAVDAAAAAGAADGGAAIERVPRDAPLPLSFPQQRLWFFEQLAPGTAVYAIAEAVELEGDLDADALERSLAEVVRRHEALRTTFAAVDGTPLQVVHAPEPLPLPRIDLSGAPGREEELRRCARAHARRPFDLERDLPLRATLVRLGPRRHVLLLALHHVAADGWSMGVLLREIAQLYAAFRAGRPSPLAELAVQYADFAVWQRRAFEGDGLAEHLAYWERQLEHAPAASPLPTDRPRPPAQSFRGAVHRFALPRELGESLKRLARGEDATLFMVLLAGFAAVLHRLSGRDDICVGTQIANRQRLETEALIGCFVNALVLRTRFAGDPTFRELLARVREAALGAYAHQDLPFEKLVEALRPTREPTRMPMIDVGLVLQNAPMPELALPGLAVRRLPFDAETAKVDLTLFVTDGDDGLDAEIEYSTDLFEPETIAALAERLHGVLGAAAAEPDRRVSALPVLTAYERRALLHEWNPPGDAVPDAGCIHELFEACAERVPDAPAVAYGSREVSYAELNRRANRLAHGLRRLGVGPDRLVGILMDRSIELIVAILAVLKAGGAYVPLDPAYPAERLSFMLAESRASLLLAEPHLLDDLSHDAEVVPIEDGATALDTGEESNPAPAASPADLAYVIFTSGSTGRPKGVMVTHGNLVSGHGAWRRAYDLERVGTSCLQLASFSFDVFAEDLVRTLCHGKRLVLAPPNAALDPARLHELIVRERIDWVEFVPATLRGLVDHLERVGGTLEQLRVVVAGSDAWSVDDYRRSKRLCGPRTRLVNSYGMSEATIDNSTYEDPPPDAPGDQLLPAGRPFDNTRLYVLDERLEPVPVGVVGEICVGGPCVTRGYVNRPALTAERFVPDPFASDPGARLYRSGDLGRFRRDGTLEFVGRADNQVTVHGSRFELGEIETTLRQHPEVEEAVVVVREDQPGEKRLVGYVVVEPRDGAGPAEPPAAEPRGEGAAPAEGADEHVSSWRLVFDDLYRVPRPEVDPTFYVEGWESSYTKDPMPAQEVREWVEQTADRIASLAPRRVLDVGCGSGLMLFRLAGGCEAYHATDVSAEPLAMLRRSIAELGLDLPQLTLEQRAADEVSGLAPGSFDALVSVSVVQYFPGLDYLLRMLEGAARVVAPGGFVLLGDLRSLPLLEAFHTSVQLLRAPPSTTAAELRHAVGQQLLYEKQLVLDPSLFAALPELIPGLAGGRALLERGRAWNELTKFRYDALVRVGEPEGVEEPAWVDWSGEGLSLAAVRELLEGERPGELALRGVPNARVAADVLAVRLLAEAPADATAQDLRAAVAAAGPSGVDPEQLWALGDALGYEVEIEWRDGARDGSYDVLLRERGAARRPPRPRAAPRAARARPRSSYANEPLRGATARRLLPELRSYLARQLPSYMVPATFVALEAMPLSPNGKVDRRALPAPDAARREPDEHVAPRSPVEQALARIWSEVLGVDGVGVGVHDSWFELGGHSLLATQFTSRAREVFQVEVPLRSLFDHPTIAELGTVVEELLIDEIERLPAEGA